MRYHVTLCVLAIALFWIPGVIAQEADTGRSDEPTPSVEELYLSSAVTVETLAYQMRSPERQVQLLALSTMEHQLDRGALQADDPALLDALAPLVDQGVFTVSRNADRLIEGYDPVVRREAVRVVGRLGTASARHALVATVRHDPEPTVAAEALFALARIGEDPTGDVTRTIAGMMMSEHVQTFDEGVIFAAIAAIGAIAQDPENVVDPASREMLVHVASDYRYPRMLRDAAIGAMSQM